MKKMNNNEDGRGDICNIEVCGYIWKSVDDTLVYMTMGTVGVVCEEASYDLSITVKKEDVYGIWP